MTIHPRHRLHLLLLLPPTILELATISSIPLEEHSREIINTIHLLNIQEATVESMMGCIV